MWWGGGREFGGQLEETGAPAERPMPITASRTCSKGAMIELSTQTRAPAACAISLMAAMSTT